MSAKDLCATSSPDATLRRSSWTCSCEENVVGRRWHHERGEREDLGGREPRGTSAKLQKGNPWRSFFLTRLAVRSKSLSPEAPNPERFLSQKANIMTCSCRVGSGAVSEPEAFTFSSTLQFSGLWTEFKSPSEHERRTLFGCGEGRVHREMTFVRKPKTKDVEQNVDSSRRKHAAPWPSSPNSS